MNRENVLVCDDINFYVWMLRSFTVLNCFNSTTAWISAFITQLLPHLFPKKFTAIYVENWKVVNQDTKIQN